MSTTGLINTDTNWNLDARPGSLILNYSNLSRVDPYLTKSLSNSAGATSFQLFNNNEVTAAGIYLCTVAGAFNSTPWVFKLSFWLPMGQKLTGGFENNQYTNALHNLHADNGVLFYWTIKYNTVSTNYDWPGVQLNLIGAGSCAAGSMTVNLYKMT